MLPPTSDKEFWADAKTYQTEKFREESKGDHYLVWSGTHAICTSCRNRHTVSIDPKKYDLKEGRIVKRVG